MIATISGASGAGKTTIAKMILAKLSNADVVVSYTTREKRNTDNPGEYKYVSKLRFWLLEKLGFFLWTVDVHGNRYGTLKSLARKALEDKKILLMLLIPDRIKNIWDYARKRGSERSIKSFYILSPSPADLRTRLGIRGDNEPEIEKRIKDCEKWDSEALASDLPYIFVKNDSRVEDTIEDIISYIEEGTQDQLF